jgi:replicative DNA helicase
MQSLYASGKSVDLLTVWAELCANPTNSVAHQFLTDCVDCCPTASSAGHYLDLVKLAWRREQATNMARYAVERVQESDDIDTVCAAIQAEWSEFCQGGLGEDRRTNAEVAAELIEKWRDPKANPNDVLWPLSALNSHIGALSDELVWIAATESTGKTAYALQMCVTLAQKGIISSFCSLESRRDKLIQRLVGMVGGINTLRLRHRLASNEEYDDVLKRVVPRIDELPIHISDASMNIEQIHAWARAEVSNGSRLLIIDNARHVRPSKTYKSEVERMMDLSLRLKWVRDEAGIPLVVLHHLNAEGDVSWSKDLKKDADILIFMTDNEDESMGSDEGGPSRSIIDFETVKNREGMKDFTAQGEFVKEHQTFRDWPAESSSPTTTGKNKE